MLYRNFITLAASAVIASADNVYLTVASKDSSIDGNSLGYPHEGAGINYFFLGTASPSALSYDTDTKRIVYNTNQYFSTNNGYVALTVSGTPSNVTFDDSNTLLVDGSSANFYACKDTNDPYSYSTSSYELMYYTSDVPDGCIAVTVVNADSTDSDITTTDAPSNSTSTTLTTQSTGTQTETSTSTVCPTCTITSQSTYEGAAAKYIPAGAFAAVAGAAAALL